jgi:hypothetical protein
MTRSIVIMVAPWVFFSVALAAVAVRLLRSRGAAARDPRVRQARRHDDHGT